MLGLVPVHVPEDVLVRTAPSSGRVGPEMTAGTVLTGGSMGSPPGVSSTTVPLTDQSPAAPALVPACQTEPPPTM